MQKGNNGISTGFEGFFFFIRINIFSFADPKRAEKVIQNKQFVLNHKGLKPGIYHYDFQVDDDFFAQVEGSEIEKAHFSVHLTLHRKSQFMELEFLLDGVVEVPCDRCLELVSLPILGSHLLVVKFGEEKNTEDEVIVISQYEETFDVSQFIYEFAHFRLPLRRVHPNDAEGSSTCNPVMIAALEKYLVLDELAEEDEDPLWDDIEK